jgi:hypothetical protein
MRPSCVFSLLAAAVFALLVADTLPAETEPRQRITAPLVAISGTDSQVRAAFYKRVTTSKEWQQIWADHLGTSVDDHYRPLFELDFEHCLMIAIFRGEQIQTRRLQIETVSENADSLVIRFWQIGYGVSVGPDGTTPPPERPYAFIVLPKTNKPIILEEKIWSKEDQARNRPPEWKEIARLSPDPAPSSGPRPDS